jgi:hypothetical protein
MVEKLEAAQIIRAVLGSFAVLRMTLQGDTNFSHTLEQITATTLEPVAF